MRSLFTLIVVMLAMHSMAQTFRLSGYLRDAESGEALAGASVLIPAQQKGTYTNAFGYFSLVLPKGVTGCLFRYQGYDDVNQLFDLQGDTTIDIGLTPGKFDIDSVQITARSGLPGNYTVTAARIKSTPALLGESDVLKALQLLPGVQGGAEGTSGMHVRGGSPDQNLILLDGVPVYNAFHAFGIFSVFNPDAIKQVTLVKSGFPARYGGRLSSVLDIVMKEGNRQEWSATGAVGLVSSKLMVEGPIRFRPKEGPSNTSVLFSARRTFFDLILGPAQRLSGNPVNQYYFYDFTAKINHRFSERSHLFFSLYTGRDRFLNRFEENSQDAVYTYESRTTNRFYWGNATAALRWSHVLGKAIFGNASLTFSDYLFQVDAGVRNKQILRSTNTATGESQLLALRSSVRDMALRYDAQMQARQQHLLRAGVSTTRHRFLPGASQYRVASTDSVLSDTTQANNPLFSWESSIYVEDEIQIGTRVTLNAGLHAALFQVRGKSYRSLQPRFSGQFRFSERIAVFASFARSVQFIHLLSNSNVSLPVDLWVSATDRVPPQKAWQTSLGFSGNILRRWEWTAEGYYKRMDGVIEYAEGTNLLAVGPDPQALNTSQRWESLVETGKGWSYGAELMLARKSSKLDVQLAYTLSWTNRQFENLNRGRVFPYKYDRRHNGNILVQYKPRPRISFQALWIYQTGQAGTLPVAAYYGLPDVSVYDEPPRILDYGDRNGYRLRDHHRLDVSISFTKQKKWGERVWQFGLYNAYARRNPFYATYWGYDEQLQRARISEVSLIPILPSVSYQFTF